MAAKKFRKSKFSCPVGGFVGERCLKHRASSMNDAHVRKSHAIDRFHAWVDRSRSHGFMRPCLDFHPRMGSRVDVWPHMSWSTHGMQWGRREQRWHACRPSPSRKKLSKSVTCGVSHGQAEIHVCPTVVASWGPTMQKGCRPGPCAPFGQSDSRPTPKKKNGALSRADSLRLALTCLLLVC